jgi:hypothetical protein
MKITNKHHKNSQIHSVPNKDSKLEHRIHLDCECQPKITTDNGHLLVEHKQVGKGDKFWNVRVANFGIKYKL